MNLMDMLSSDGDSMFQQDTISNFLDDPVYDQPEIKQPPNGVYFFPTLLTNIQKDINELCIKIFGNELVNEVYQKKQRSKIHSLLGAEDMDDGEVENGDDHHGFISTKLTFNEKLEFIFEQLEIATNHPNLLVDHFLPKKLLLSEINERLVNMSGKFMLFNKIIDSFLDNFFGSVKYPELPVYNILVVSESVKELELIEGLIIGKDLYYNNISTMKLYDDNRGIPPKFNKDTTPAAPSSGSSSDTDIRVRKSRKSNPSTKKFKPVICLHLITTSQLYNNYTSILSPGLQFKLIFSFDEDIDANCPSIEMIRNQYQNVYERNPIQIPIILPVPIYSVNHIQTIIPKPLNSLNRNELIKWKFDALTALVYNRFNIYDEPETDFFVNLYGKSMNKFHTWFLDWDTVKFPLEDDEFMGKFNDKLNTNIHEEKLIKRIDKTHLLPIHGSEFDGNFVIDNFDYKSYKTKFTDLLTKRFQQINLSISNLRDDILPGVRLVETERQVTYDDKENSIADNYRKLRRLNEDATFVEKKQSKAETDFSKVVKEKQELQDKLDMLTSLMNTETDDIDAKLQEQSKALEYLTQEESNLDDELNKITDENDALRVQYQDSSSEALQLSVQIQKLKEKNTKVETKSNGPGVKILPSLIKKDDLISHEQTYKRITGENEFLRKYFDEKLDKVIGERKTLMEQSSSTSRSNNRVSRASTPY